MEISWLQAMIFALLAACSGMIGGFGQPYGWYTLSRPLVAAVVVGLIMGDLKSAIILGAAMQVAYIAMITLFNTINSISTSVTARIKQYGAMRAVGMDGNQFTRMILA